MVVNIRKKRELISRMLGVGTNRVRFEPDKLDDIADSITRENIRALIKKEIYVVRVRSMRYHLKVLKDRSDINRETYWSLYKKVNGGQVRSLAHLRELVKKSKN